MATAYDSALECLGLRKPRLHALCKYNHTNTLTGALVAKLKFQSRQPYFARQLSLEIKECNILYSITYVIWAIKR